METVYLGLGSNLGDRRLNIVRALEMLDGRIGRHWLRLSGMYESASWGFDGNDFINCVVCYEVDMEPDELLDVCKDIERESGREAGPLFDAEGRRLYRNRPIDIDIILFGDRKIDTDRLTVPHPLMHEREFVMKPLREIYEGNI